MKKLKILTILWAIVILGNVFTAEAAEKNNNDTIRPLVTVRGMAKIELAPDCAFITFGVTNFGSDLSTAQHENDLKAEAVQKSLLASGIDGKLITTSYFNVQPQYYESDRNKIKGYQINNEVRVRVDNLSLLGTIINRAMVAGANDVSSLNFSLRDEAEAKTEALTLATKNALKKANALAEAVNKNIIRVVMINEEGVGNFQPLRRDYVAMKGANFAEASSVPVQPGELTVTAEVVLSCEMD